ncbi:DNA polymerase III subunit alpha [Oligoflexia bacterium]|nr:DNA polymerase III subunit alpha [Oligoflexia bacterium]
MEQFVHLHLHSQYSLLDGLNRIPGVLETAHAMGQPAVALTDHGNMHGAIEFYLAGKKTGIKPIIGCELYVAPTSRFERKTIAQGGAGTRHLTVLAQDMTGYRNLCRLVSLAYKEGFYFKPRVDHELLREYSDGLVAMSGCMSGEVSRFAGRDDYEGAKERAELYAKIFPGRYYLEVQPHKVPEQMKVNQLCLELGRELGLPLVATNDCHYPTKAHHHAQEVLICISTAKRITDPDRLKHEGFDLHLKSLAEVTTEFGAWEGATEAINNTVAIAEKCNVEFDFSKHFMPKFKTDSTESLLDIMTSDTKQGLVERIEEIKGKGFVWSEAKQQEYKERLEEEIALIGEMGFAGYFLVVADFIVWAKRQGIPVGPGRGSAAGSLVAYALRITELDPIENKLLFERFLNPARVSLPDIDVDFCIHGRDRVIQYVVDKYGADNVAQIATFGTLKAKAAIKDVGRVLGVSYAETDRVAQLVPAPRQGFDYPLEEALKMEKRLADYAAGEGQELISLALKVEGLNRHTSTHAAGVVIGDRALSEMLPMMVDKDGNDVTQYSMKYVEKVGLVKFDFLGLKTLTVIHSACKLIGQSRGEDVDPNAFPLTDRVTYDLLCSGNTTGVFQLESTGITDMTMRLKPSCFDDLVAILALYRPGPLDSGMADHYIERKNGVEKVSYPHPFMEEILSDTYGIILYQEQIMQLARTLAGYSLGEADLLRRAMGKKNPEEMAKQRVRFIDGALERKIDKRVAEGIFGQMETFARYGFNRSHSAAYALISFQTAYLKAHYNVEFMAALMSNEMGDSDKTLKNLTECRMQAIEILPPDVNSSVADFSVEEGKIRYGLSAVKGIGEKAVLAFIDARNTDGKFEDFEDCVSRVDLHAVNKRVIEGLIKCGAFDFAGISRRELMDRMEDVVRAGQVLQRDEETNQMALFSGEAGQRAIPRRSTTAPEWPINKKLAFEREALGFYISGHPLAKYKHNLEHMGAIATTQAKKQRNKAVIKIGGVVTALKLKNTRRGDRYATFILEDWLGTIEALAWPDVYQKIAHMIVADDPVVITGRIDASDERVNLIVESLESLIDVRDKTASQGVLVFGEEDRLDDRMERLVELLGDFSGSCPIKVELNLEGERLSVVLRDRNEAPIRVSPCEELCDEVEQLFGRPVLSFV